MRKHIFAWVLVLAMTGSLIPTASAQTTPDMHGELTHYNGHTYMLVNERVSWNFAELYCRVAGGHLASITSLEENGFAMELFNQGGLSNYYIGGTNSDQTGGWSWLGGDAWSYENWQNGGPDNSSRSQDVLRVEKSSGWKWDNIGTGEKYGFLCEWDSTISSLRPTATLPQNCWAAHFAFSTATPISGSRRAFPQPSRSTAAG